MGFLSGSTTFTRFRITNDPTDEFGDEHLELLEKNKIQSSGRNLYEQAAVGFLGGNHILDTKFDFEKNIIGDAMHFAIRIDTCQIPGPIKRAWTQIELAGIMKDSQGGRPTKVQRDEANEAVEARCSEESKKGNYTKMAVIPILWDSLTETVYVGNTSEKTTDACLGLIEDVFGLEFAKITSGKLASEFADTAETTEALFNAMPAPFHPESSGNVVRWNGMQDNYDFLGNEFLLWLWWNLEKNGDTFSLSDESEVSGMFARALSLDCPIGENGKESISSESPVLLPEARLAVRMGKQPRKAGLSLIRNDLQFDFSLQAETFAIGSARIKTLGDDSVSSDNLDRIENFRQLSETLDLVFDEFCSVRLGGTWDPTFSKIKTWIETDLADGKIRRIKAA
ncbi:MAG: hypothetical protein AAF939_19080 [Planctomycetota bacterium]